MIDRAGVRYSARASPAVSSLIVKKEREMLKRHQVSAIDTRGYIPDAALLRVGSSRQRVSCRLFWACVAGAGVGI